MRILQIIDSLEAGGAERMAVNYANGLAHEIEFSGLVATRKEGSLAYQLKDNVEYVFLDKKKTVDILALFRLRNFVKKHKVTLIHAHSTSFFTAFLLKLVCPYLKLIWHDHYGNSEYLEKRKSIVLKTGLLFFDGIVVVNEKLKMWTHEKLHFNNAIYLPNFVSENEELQANTVLKGETGKRIVCLANLRVQKNHFLIIELAIKIKKSHPDWSFHLIGKDFKDIYSDEIKNLIIENNLQTSVFIYGTKQDIRNILTQGTIGILTSNSEGLPLALLEYGLCKKPVVVTAVGEIPVIVQNGINGFLIPPNDSVSFYNTLVVLMESEKLKNDFARLLHTVVKDYYSEKKVLREYLTWLKNKGL